MLIARQWNGHPVRGTKTIRVTDGLKTLEKIISNTKVPDSLKEKAHELQINIIKNNTHSVSEDIT